ncbi:MAG: SusC/RagA family TonB-linked outer membrane protein [Mucilaginibacter sp.]|nr:SusC/RagA family TonB-linked outer membrane protein [Mucilaginibacter sp.]
MYKKFTLTKGVGLPYARKIFLIMRLATLLLTITIMQVSAATFAQKVSLNEKNADLKTVFKELRKQTGYDFICTEALFNTAKKVTIQTNGELKEVLDQVFDGQPLSFSLTDKTVVVSEKELSFIQKAKAYLAQVTIMAKVTDELGNPMVGVTVKIKDANQAVTTDSRGNFTITVPNEQTVIGFSYVGFEPVELQAKSIVNGSAIILKPNTTNLKEVVINKGYYSEKEILTTGDVSKITAADIDKKIISNTLQALQGTVPGLYVEQQNGAPDGVFNIQIRSKNGIYNGNDPFYEIDGVPYQSQLPVSLFGPSIKLRTSTNPLIFINPYDIESIEVLKDADATAIYGSRAANGAILITTKKGKVGKLTLNVDARTGISSISEASKGKLLNTQQYLEMRREAFKNDGLPVPSFSTNPSDRNFDINGFWDQSRYTDWANVLSGKTAQNSTINVNLSGGTTNTQYLIGVNYSRQSMSYPTLIGGDNAVQKPEIHFNLNTTSTDQKFKLSFTGTFLTDQNRLPNLNFGSAFTLAPDAPPVFNPDGSLNWAPIQPGQAGTWTNPLAGAYQQSNNNVTTLNTNAVISYKFFPGLTLSGNVGYSRVNGNNSQITPIIFRDPGTNPISGSSQFQFSNTSNWIAEPKLDYNKSFKKHNIAVTVGSTWQNNTNSTVNLSGSNYSSDALLNDPASAGTIRTSSQISQYLYNGAYGRIHYDFDGKYIINLTARRDGSNRFGPGHQFGNFGSVGAAWNFGDEGFIKKSIPILSSGKLRGSYGITGNDQIGDYQYLDVYSSLTNTYQGGKGLIPVSQYNKDLAWEKDAKLEIGLDLGFFNERLNGKFSYYRNRSGNQLSGLGTSIVTGFDAIPYNLPIVVQNSGWELAISSINVKSESFFWQSTFNISINKNVLKSVSNPYNDPGLANLQKYIGQAIVDRVQVYRFAGVNPQNGLYQFYDAKGNITQTPDADADTHFISLQPKFFGGFGNTIGYKEFSLDVQFSFVDQRAPGLITTLQNIPGYAFNQPVGVLNRWQKPGDVAAYMKFTEKYTPTFSYAASSDWAYPDAPYIRLRSLSLAWKIPESYRRKLQFSDASVFLQGQNLLTITKYKDGDPETHSLLYPPPQIWSLGLKVSL